jgi:hypothetical protein
VDKTGENRDFETHQLEEDDNQKTDGNFDLDVKCDMKKTNGDGSSSNRG